MTRPVLPVTEPIFHVRTVALALGRHPRTVRNVLSLRKDLFGCAYYWRVGPHPRKHRWVTASQLEILRTLFPVEVQVVSRGN